MNRTAALQYGAIALGAALAMLIGFGLVGLWGGVIPGIGGVVALTAWLIYWLKRGPR